MAEAAVVKSMLRTAIKQTATETMTVEKTVPMQQMQPQKEKKQQRHQKDVCCGKCERCNGQTCVSDDDAVVCASCHALFCKRCIDCVCPQCACCSLCEEGKARIYKSTCKSCSLESKE